MASRWALTQYGHYWIGDILTIFVTTNVQCHLWLRYTTVEPALHQHTEVTRGLKVMNEPKYCFVQWSEVEQAEPGDTVDHTFTIPDWTEGMLIWWYLYGSIANIPSTSTTGLVSLLAFDQGMAFDMQHTSLTDKERREQIDHADRSINEDKLGANIDALEINFDAAWVRHRAHIYEGQVDPEMLLAGESRRQTLPGDAPYRYVIGLRIAGPVWPWEGAMIIAGIGKSSGTTISAIIKNIGEGAVPEPKARFYRLDTTIGPGP